jgi:hypothetical protein
VDLAAVCVVRCRTLPGFAFKRGHSAGENCNRVSQGLCSAQDLANLWKNRHDRLMKHRFASLTSVAVAMAVAWGMEARGQGRGISGQQLVAEAARRVAAEPAISAEMRYEIDAFGHELVGTGSYLQLGAGPEKLLRLDLRMQVGGKLATVQEIRGEDAYWVRRDVPPQPPTLGRVDLKQLRKAMAQPSGLGASNVLPQGEWIVLGGLGRLLKALEQNFDFATPRADELTFNTTDGKSLVKLPIWTVGGLWNPEKLSALVGKEPGKLGALPEQLPDRVELVLSRTEDVLPLFPYRITYWQTPAAGKKDKNATPDRTPRKLMKIELFKISNDPKRINATDFQYQPGDQEVQELTQFYVQRYSAETKLR